MTTKTIKHASNAQKKSSRPTQPGNRSTAPRHSRRSRKQLSIVHQISEIVKHIKWGWIVAMVGATLIAVTILVAIFGSSAGIGAKAAESTVPDTVIVTVQETYVFKNGEIAYKR